jgi:hypothetical protein
LPAVGPSRGNLRAWPGAVRHLLSTAQVNISLSPEEITLVRVSTGRRARELARRRLQGPGGGDWRPLVAALAEALREPAWHEGRASVVLSNHFVRYVCVPWVEDLGGEAERLAYARHCFVQLYGEPVGRWAVRLSDDRYGAAQLASAIDPELLDALTIAVSGASLRLTSLQPGFMAAFNHCRDALTADPFWFVHIEPGRACLAHVVGGAWVTIRSARLGSDWATDLGVILSREQLIQDAPATDSRIYVYAPAYAPTLVSGEWLTRHGLRLPALDPAASVTAGVPLTENVS